MANAPVLLGTVRITVNSVAKEFNNVTELKFDYNTGKVNIVDMTGSFYFSILAITSLTYTIVSGLNGSHNIVAS